MKRKPAPVVVRSGDIEFYKVNAVSWDWRDLYHWLLSLSWPYFALFLLAAYLSINALFAALYCLLTPGSIAEMPPRSFPDAFFFSVETLATVGYGHMYPVALAAHLIATAEILTGMFGMAVITGLIFVRFARPRASLVFSNCVVLSNFDGVPALMIRIANQRHQPMVEAEFHMVLIRSIVTKEDQEMAVFHELKLQIGRAILFPAAMTIRHLIDETSPLYGKTPADFENENIRLMASMVCVDSVVPAAVQSQHTYTWRNVRFGQRFVEIYTGERGSGKLVVDYGKLHDTEAAPEAQPLEPVS